MLDGDKTMEQRMANDYFPDRWSKKRFVYNRPIKNVSMIDGPAVALANRVSDSTKLVRPSQFVFRV